MKFVILHGTLGSPNENWFPWLAGELKKLGHSTFCPQLPTPEGQTPQNWIKVIADLVEKEDLAGEDLIFVAHSRSPLAVCRYLQTRTSPVRACFFVAGFASRLPVAEEPFPTLNDPFDDLGAEWGKVKKNCQKFICFASDNDPYVPLDIARDFAAKLSAEFILISGAGHLNSESGYTQFPLLLEEIKSLL
ncbi:MAG: alpha/beta hydrolase [Patescibacteria group bacterium]